MHQTDTHTRIFILSIFVVASCGRANSQTKSNELSPPRPGVQTDWIDKSVNPCVDFFHYACGNWIKQNSIPPDRAGWGVGAMLQERNIQLLRTIAEDAAKHQGRTALDQKIGAYYAACMDEQGIEKRGIEPLKPELSALSRVTTIQQLVPALAALHKKQINVFFSFGSLPDPDNSSVEMGAFDQGGLGLPERGYYFRTDAKSKEIRERYVAHIAMMFELVGTPAVEAKNKAQNVMRIETDLAKASMGVVDRRDPKKLVHKYTRQELETLTPAIDWSAYFAAVDAPEMPVVNIAVPDFLKQVNSQLVSSPISELKDYVAWHIINTHATQLPSAFVEENFNFFGQTLTGARTLRPRWKRCVASTDSQLGEALGRAFVEKTFGEQGKRRTLEMVSDIEREMAADIDSLTWMSAATKKEALQKLHAATNKIGYPDKWRDYSSVTVTATDYLANTNATKEFEFKRDVRKIGNPVDRSEWDMTPPTVNAYYDPQQNTLNFPAGILQPPLYSNAADDSANFGAAGNIIGHELTHGFDDEGREFDASGNLRDWWQKQDAEQFQKLADCFIREYDGFEALPGMKVNGKLTLGENIADNGGMRLAYAALEYELAKHAGSKDKTAGGYTPAQRFFLGLGQAWCGKVRDEAVRLQIQTDPHSPQQFRVNGVVRNMPEFSTAFGCHEGDPLAPIAGKVCRVW
jgi:endothelin-converting enzyme/putative endopeptidase